MARKQTTLSDQLRQAIRDSGVSRYRIAKETGLTQAALSKFVNGLMGLSLESIDSLGKYLDLEITTKRKG
jgi:predicted transcriptional regulator